MLQVSKEQGNDTSKVSLQVSTLGSLVETQVGSFSNNKFGSQ